MALSVLVQLPNDGNVDQAAHYKELALKWAHELLVITLAACIELDDDESMPSTSNDDY